MIKKKKLFYLLSFFLLVLIIEAASWSLVNFINNHPLIIKSKNFYRLGKINNEFNEYSNFIPYIDDSLKFEKNLKNNINKNLFFKTHKKFDKQNNENILIQGDSWAAAGYEFANNNINNISKEKKFGVINAGKISYSISPMNVQLDILTKKFNIKPTIIIAIIDQTDLGDELCRYKDLRKVINGKVVVRPVPPGEPGFYTLHSLFSKYEVLTSSLPFTIRLIKYEILNNQIVKRMKTSKNKCGYKDILGILKTDISDHDLNYWDNIFNEYINNVFSNSDTKHLILVTHPHKYHLNGDYVSDINNLVSNNVRKSQHKDKITLLNPFQDYKIKKINEIFIEDDTYSHLQPNYITNYYLPKITIKIQVPKWSGI